MNAPTPINAPVTTPALPDALLDAAAQLTADAATRHDGWTPDRRRTFLEALSEGHTVEAACRFVGLSVASAYALRRRAGGRAFAIGWRAACLLARDRLADILTSRAIDGQVETLTRADGETITRHRYDNRLAASLLGRLDRLAERPAATPAAPVAPIMADTLDEGEAARIVAQDFAAFLDLVSEDAEPARVEAFIEAAWALRHPQLPQLRPAYADDHDDDDEDEPDDDGPIYWQERGEWHTDAPPPKGFDGHQNGKPGDLDYWRTLTDAEREEIEAEDAADAEEED